MRAGTPAPRRLSRRRMSERTGWSILTAVGSDRPGQVRPRSPGGTCQAGRGRGGRRARLAADPGQSCRRKLCRPQPRGPAPSSPRSRPSGRFLSRLDTVYSCLCEFALDINTRPTTESSAVITRPEGWSGSIRTTGSSAAPLEELFDTFLHEVAHHLEYTEPDSFRPLVRESRSDAQPLFWRILGELKGRWLELQRNRI